MKIVFLDQLGCYAAVAAASYEAGIIGEDAKASDIERLSQFGAHQDMSVGNMSYIGKNREGYELYTLGTGRYSSLIAISALDLFEILGVTDEIKIIDVSADNSLLITIASYLKWMRVLEKEAVYFAAYIIEKNMPQIVRKIKDELRMS